MWELGYGCWPVSVSEEVLSQWGMRGRYEEHLLCLQEQSRVSKNWPPGRL